MSLSSTQSNYLFNISFWFTKPILTKCHKLSGINNRSLFSESWEASCLSLVIFSLHIVFPLYLSLGIQVSPFYKDNGDN